MNARFFKLVVVSATIFLVAAVVYWYFEIRHVDQASGASSEALSFPPQVISEGITGEGSKVYASEKYRFQLSYPQSLTVKEYKEAGGAMSATFENTAEEQGFQIYVTPYADKQITEARFKVDVPSGVRKDQIDVLVDNTPAILFSSENGIMGETREVWFIKNGFLYEVVTYKRLDTWLAGIMQSWKFL